MNATGIILRFTKLNIPNRNFERDSNDDSVKSRRDNICKNVTSTTFY